MEREQIESLFRRWHKPMRKWLSHRRVNRYDIEDMVQEVFVRLMRYPVEATNNPQGYIFRVAINVSNEWAERACNRKPHLRYHSCDLTEDSRHVLDDDLIDPALNPEEFTDQTMTAKHIRECIDELPARHRHVLNLHLSGMTYKKIAEREGMTYRTVLRDLCRAYSRLRELIDKVAV